MIINMEWGNFNKLKVTKYDRRLDKESVNPGAQILEKMVSGLYLGEICRLIMADLISKKMLFDGRLSANFDKRMMLKGEVVSQVLADKSGGLTGIMALLRCLGVKDPKVEDGKTIRKICGLLSVRAARISAAAIFAVITKIDPGIKRKHAVAIDGSVYEKLPGFSGNIKRAVNELSRGRAGKIKIALTKDGSGYGAAIIAAISARGEAH
jgi:hexokinase